MPIFYRKAYEAACRGNVPADLRDEHFDNWKNLEQALLWLPTDEQLCDAVYGNWLMRLDAPGGAQQWDLREHLIQGGGLDANYLAELAQNANDAADGNDAELRVKPEPGWLLVANNGRKITPLNLIGLCDFFGHFALPVPGVRAIGKFGVGFKSSFRIADEVFVHTWAGGSSFTFRIPITVPGRVVSHPNTTIRDRILSQLSAVGAQVNPRFASVEYAGFCTPESVAEPPPQIVTAVASLATTPHGTLFGYHLHDEGRLEVEQRIESQTEKIYELCPLFVPCLRTIELGSHRMSMTLLQEKEIQTPVGGMRIAKATLSVGTPRGRQSHVRFWRLVGTEPEDKWQLALHADSAFKLQVRRTDDEQAASVRDGSAYAFFPLHAVIWPLKLHLHLDLPTALSRGDWAHGNIAQSTEVEEQIGRAVRVMANWLAVRGDLWHPEWRVEALFEQTPTQDQKWPQVLWRHLCETAQSVALLRCLWGGQTTAKSRAVRIISRDEARAAWQTLGEAIPQLREDWPLTESVAQTSFGQAELSAGDVADLFEQARPLMLRDARLLRAFVSAFLSCQAQTISNLEGILGPLPIELASGSSLTFQELLEQPAGAELAPEWHSTFRQVAVWADQADWRTASAFRRPLRDKLRQLSQSQIYVTWEELPARMAEEQAWQVLGELFWNTPRTQCPTAKLASVAAAIRVPNGQGGWLLLSEAWLDDDSPVICFAGLLTAWPLHYTNDERKRITGLLTDWGLFAEWERTTKAKLKEKLPGQLTLRLTEHSGGDAFGVIFNQAFEDARQPLRDGWKHIVSEAEKSAVSRFLHARSIEQNLLQKTVLSVHIAPTVRAALCLDAGFVPGPIWLTDDAHKRICHLGLQQNLGFQFLSQQDFLQQRGTLARELLDRFHLWMDPAPTREALAGLNEMAATVTCANRRNWPVRFSDEHAPLLRELIHAQAAVADANPTAHINRLLLEAVDDWRTAERLPTLLAQVPSLAEASMQPHTLILEFPNVTRTPIAREQIPAGPLEVGPVRALVDAGNHGFFTSTQALKLRWRQGGHVVATLPAADYFVDGNQLVFAHSLPPADEEQFREVLALYQRYDVTSAAYRRDQEAGLAGFSLYQNYRDQITKVLIEKEVRAVGYGEQHVLRELLQNAESAYASKASTPAEPWFHFIVTAPAQGGLCKVIACHMGRAFNEPDKAGNERLDVDRIVKVNAPNQNTEDEVGRFNKGFKCVFSVAQEQRVSIHSGGFRFTVQDLLLRVPNPPKKDPNDHNPETKFTFDAKVNDVRVMLGLDETQIANTPLRVFNASSFVFLRHLRRAKVVFAGREWTWSITRQTEGNGWGKVTVNAGAGRPAEDFLVFHGRQDGPTGRCYAVAVRLKDGFPTKLEPDWRSLRLTFETDEPLNVDVLVNGQFDAALGRRNLVDVAVSGLVDAAFQAAVARCEAELTRENSKMHWLAWARVLNLSDGLKGLKDRVSSFETLSKRVEQFFTTRIPHAGATKSVEQLVFPTGLMRELLRTNYAGRWGIPSAEWIDPEIERELPASDRAEFSFDEWLGRQPSLTPLLRSVQRDLESEAFKALARFTPQQKQELEKARRILEEKLRPQMSPTPAERPPDRREEWSVADLWHWWEHRRDRDRQDYTLDGANWPLLFGSNIRPAEERAAHLRATLRDVETDSGRTLWYRIMSLACLMSAGRRMSELRGFWRQELESRGFWSETSGKAFGQGTDAMFDALLRRRFSDVAASGEDAHFWRRVFYDLRKIHRLVWGDGFPAVLLELAQSHERGPELLNFLRSGQLTGQRAWEGVFGQSAGVPLFFLVRELRRLRVVENRQLDPLAFFACAPVRWAAWRLCWLDEDMVRRTDFGSVAKVSELLHEKIANDHEHGLKLLEDYDIPLLHYGLTQ